MSNSFHLPVDRSEAWEFAVNVHVGVCLQVDRECGLQPIDSYVLSKIASKLSSDSFEMLYISISNNSMHA